MSEWFNCEVVRVGAAAVDNNVYIRLRPLGGEFPPRAFIAAPNIKRELLATALTAISIQLHVNAYIEARDEYSELYRLYVTRDT
jgi:hypothetical protein